MRLLTVSVISVIKSMANLIMRPFQVITQLGANNISVQMTTGETKSLDAQEQPQPVQQKRKRDKAVAQLTIVATPQKRTRKLAPQERGQGGLLLDLPALSMLQPAKPARKAKAKPAQSTKVALLSQQGQALVLTPTETLSGERGQLRTRASKTRQVAKVAPTKKQKAAASTTPVKKRTKKQTPAQTHTARQSKARGS